MTLARNLELENQALLRRDGEILVAVDHGDRLVEMQERLRDGLDVGDDGPHPLPVRRDRRLAPRAVRRTDGPEPGPRRTRDDDHRDTRCGRRPHRTRVVALRPHLRDAPGDGRPLDERRGPAGRTVHRRPRRDRAIRGRCAMVGEARFELARLATPAPKAGASTVPPLARGESTNERRRDGLASARGPASSCRSTRPFPPSRPVGRRRARWDFGFVTSSFACFGSGSAAPPAVPAASSVARPDGGSPDRKRSTALRARAAVTIAAAASNAFQAARCGPGGPSAIWFAELLAHLPVLARIAPPQRELLGQRVPRVRRPGPEGAGHVVDPGLHRLRQRVIRLLRIRREEPSADEAGNPERAAGEQEDRARADGDDRERVLLDKPLDVKRLAQLRGRSLELRPSWRRSLAAS